MQNVIEYLPQCQDIHIAGKLVIGQPVPGSGSSQGGTSCSAMAVSNNLLFVADNRGVVYTWRCNIKNGILQVNVTYCHAAVDATTPAQAPCLNGLCEHQAAERELLKENIVLW